MQGHRFLFASPSAAEVEEEITEFTLLLTQLFWMQCFIAKIHDQIRSLGPTRVMELRAEV